MNITFLILIMAIFSLVIGLSLYFWVTSHRDYERFHTTIVISWLLIPLFPVLLIFLFFPDSSASGSILGFKVAGAFGAYFLIFWFGTNNSLKANDLDAREGKIRTSEKELQEKAREQRTPVVLQNTETFIYRLKSNPGKKIGLITGSIESLKIADVWVSSENTNMQMSRFYERSVSGVIRYYGAKKDLVGNVVDDIIAKELAEIRGDNLYVQPATVLVTGPGELQNTHNVKKIFHIASVQGEVGVGYRPINNIHTCVTNALNKVDSAELRGSGIKTILFPLIGVGTAKGDLKAIAQSLLQAAISYLETTTGSSIECVYFLTWTNIELEICRAILEQSEKLQKS